MTTDRDFKRLVRGRMQKTGESYTAARSILLKRPTLRPRDASPAPAAAGAPRVDHGKLAGMTDAAILGKTGRTWAGWVEALDGLGAERWSHRDIAECVHEKFKVGDWWSQTVTVGYERIKGLREIGQRRNGSFEASRSKTVAVPVARLYRAFTDSRVRRKWLTGSKFTVRSATPNKYVRITWGDGTSVEVVLLAKGEAKAAANVSHRKLVSKQEVDRIKAYWGERLEALAGLFEKGR